MKLNRMNGMLFTRREGDSSQWGGAHIVRAVFVLVMMAIAMLPSAASAAVPGLTRVEASSAFNSEQSKAPFAACPAGQKVIGGGGDIFGANGRVGMRTLVPSVDNTGYTAFAVETSATNENWLVRAYAICANASAVPDLQQVESPLAAQNSNFFNTATVRCAVGKKVVGMGARTLGAFNPSLVRMFPDGRAVQVAAAEVDGGTTQTWNVQAVALCVNESSAIDVERIQKIDTSGSAAQVTRHMTCPSGKVAIGGGSDTLNAPAGRVLLRRITPSADKLSVSITNGESAFGTTNNWSQVSYVLCATP